MYGVGEYRQGVDEHGPAAMHGSNEFAGLGESEVDKMCQGPAKIKIKSQRKKFI
jgi:hypothetical protein